jgi:hypothetical protein
MVCLRNISVDSLHKGYTEDDDKNNNNNYHSVICQTMSFTRCPKFKGARTDGLTDERTDTCVFELGTTEVGMQLLKWTLLHNCAFCFNDLAF